MKSHLDTVSDPVVDALLALLTVGLNEGLGVELGGDVVAATVNHPAPVHVLPAAALPLLSIHRGSEEHRRNGPGKDYERTVVFVIDYVTPVIAYEEVSARWPLLQRVWDDTVRLIDKGRTPGLLDGRNVLKDACVSWLGFGEGDAPQMTTHVIEVEEPEVGEVHSVYPAFRGRVTLRHMSIDTAARAKLTELRQLYAKYVLIETDAKVDLIEDAIAVPDAGTTAEPIEDDDGLGVM